MPDVDGGLVGGASLKADEFLKICAAAQSSLSDDCDMNWLHTATYRLSRAARCGDRRPGAVAAGQGRGCRRRLRRRRFGHRVRRARLGFIPVAHDGDAGGIVLRDEPDARVPGRPQARRAEERDRSRQVRTEQAPTHDCADCADGVSTGAARTSRSRRRRAGNRRRTTAQTGAAAAAVTAATRNLRQQ